MPRIADDVIARIKSAVRIEDLARETGVELRRQGKDQVGRCPFGEHTDSTPSLTVTPAKGLWHCFGCGAGGDSIAWVQKTQGLAFRPAVELLSRRVDGLGGGLRKLDGGAPPKATVRALFDAPFRPEDDDAGLLAGLVRFYRSTFDRSPKGCAYLAERGIADTEMLERFGVGLADGSLGYHLPRRQKDGRDLRERLAALGVFREKSRREHFDGCVTFPVYDEDGRVVQIYGRRTGRVDVRWSAAGSKHLVLPVPLRGVWNWPALRESTEIVLCEAILDACTAIENGFPNTIATWGADGFTEDHERALVRHGVRKVLIAFDRDDAGDAGAKTVAAKLAVHGIDCYRVELPRGMDVNDYARKMSPADRALALAIRGAVWMGTGRAPAAAAAFAPARPALRAVPAEPAPASTPSNAQESPSLAAFPLPPGSEEPAAGEGNLVGVTSTAAVTGSPAQSTPLAGGLAPESLTDDEAVFRIADRLYRLRGLAKTTNQSAKLHVTVSRDGVGFEADSPIPGRFVDIFDLFQSKARWSFQKSAAADIGVSEDVVKRDLGRLLLAVEEIQSQRARKAAEPRVKVPALTPEEVADALELAADPRYFERVLEAFDRCGLAGETTNKLVAWIAAGSRRLERPLAVIIQSSSSAGKSALMDAVLAFIPEEEREKYSAVTGKALYYIPGENGLAHKVLAISEEEGAETASYALKMLQSEGELSIISTGKDGSSGRLVTHEYRVQGPVMILLTTTRIELDEELQNRCLVLTVDESREQTERIHRMQRERETLEGLLAEEEKPKIRRLMQNAQRILRPVRVMNPYAPQLEFLASRLRMRRDHEKYLTLIRAIAFLGQYQRPTKTAEHQGKAVEYVEVTPADIALANRIAGEVLGRSLDELPPQTRRFLDLLDEMVAAGCERERVKRTEFWFYRRDVREHMGWSTTQVKLHLDRLVELEYVAARGGANGRRFVYELLYDGAGRRGERFLPGLVDVEKLTDPSAHRTTGRTEEPTCRPPVGPLSATYRAPVGVRNDNAGKANRADSTEDTENAPGPQEDKSGVDRTAVDRDAVERRGASVLVG